MMDARGLAHSVQPTMNAIAQSEYGSPDVLHLKQVETPRPQANEVLVKVHAAAVNAGDWHLMRGTPFLIRLVLGGLRHPKIQTIGSDLAGTVVAVGPGVTQFEVGDAIFGNTAEQGFGAFAEYVCAPQTVFVSKPEQVSFEAAAAVIGSAATALHGLRDCAQVQPGQRVLVNGAAGGVGSFTVQIAKAFGAEVTGACRSDKVDWVRSLGVTHVLDSSHLDITQLQEQFDVVVDTAGFRAFQAYFSILKPGGCYVFIGGSTACMFAAMILGPLIGKLKGRRVRSLISIPSPADLCVLQEMLATGAIAPALDRLFPLSEVPEAIRYLESRQVKGKVGIQVS